ncbi:MAG: PfkB family carbohydrate kinase [Candidatus Latescibacterota bacterium]|nr:PfkB family carbohydrate kinase [Candidatus Latescibacterota bacterium]
MRSSNLPRCRWLVVGSATVDCIIRGEERVYKAGGVVVYGGLTLLRSGHEVAVCANIAANDRDVIIPLHKEGGQLHLGDDTVTTHFVNRVEGDDRQQEMPLAARPIERADLQGAVRASNYALLGPLHPHDIAEDALAWLSARGNLTLCADLQGYIRRVEDGLVRARVSASVEGVLQAAECIKLSQDELDLLSVWAKCDIGQLIERYNLREVVVTKGSLGGYVQDLRGVHRFEAEPVTRVCDPTGAGDVFFAAYLSARIVEKKPTSIAVRAAARLAAEQVGGTFLGEDILALRR